MVTQSFHALPMDLYCDLQEEGSVASGKQRYRSARKKTEPDNKHKATCFGEDKLGSTDRISREQRGKKTAKISFQSRERHDPSEFSTCTADEAQELKFQVNCLYY